MDLIRSFNQSLGMTVVMVTHEQALAEKYAGRMLHLADGKLVDDVGVGGIEFTNPTVSRSISPQGGSL